MTNISQNYVEVKRNLCYNLAMRIIAGRYKGRVVPSPKGLDVRPTLDRTKETLFNIINFQMPQAVVLDLFAGTGQLGFEALSRGAESVVFCDVDRRCTQSITEFATKLQANCQVRNVSYDAFLATCNDKFDVVFIDPPYQSGVYVDVLHKLCHFKLLSQDALVVCECARDTVLPETVDLLTKYDSRQIGTVRFEFYKLLEEEK